MDVLITSNKTILVLLAAGGYALAAILMKVMANGGANHAVMAALVVFFVVIVLTEVRLLQHMELSNVYVLILGVETMLILGYALWVGEAFSNREIAGGAMVLVGTMLVSS